MIPTVNSLALGRWLLNGVSQHCPLIVDITIPNKAIDVDHAPLARCSSEGFFVARNWVGLICNQQTSDNRLSKFTREPKQKFDKAL